MKYKKYPSYKDSGVEWLGDIPENWNLLKNRHIFKTKDKVLNDKEDMTVLSLTTNGVKVKNNLSFGKSTESYVGHQMVYPGNLVFTPRDFDQTPILSGVSKYKGCISNLYLVLETNSKAYNHFVDYYWWGLKYKVNYFKNFSYGIRFSYNFEQFKEIPFLQPPIQEQQQIADFLDKATAKIDTLIKKQTKQIELLKEKRQAVISHAVTKGINPNVPMKDSGVEWLGEIPEHWTCLSIGYISKIDSGATPNRDKNSYWGGNIPWIKTGEVNYSIIEDSQEKITMEGFLNSSLKLAKKGTILMAMYGQGITRGRIAVLGIDATYNQACAAINFNHKMSNEFAQYFFIASYNYNRDLGNETSQMNLNIAIINKMKITLPPLEEQQQIANYLDEKTSKIDALIEKSNKSIELLKEKRTALISAAVTGKIDVREFE